MNSTETKIHNLYNSIVEIDSALLTTEVWSNHAQQIITVLSKDFRTAIHSGELLINLQPGQQTLNKDAISYRSMQLINLKNPSGRVEIIHSPVHKSLLIYLGKVLYYKQSDDINFQYPRVRNPTSVSEQYKVHAKLSPRLKNAHKMILSIQRHAQETLGENKEITP